MTPTSIDLSQMTNIPSAEPPPGVIPNFRNPPTNTHLSTTITSIVLPLMMIFVVLRVYTNLWVSRHFMMSDYICVLAACASIAYCGVLYLTISQGSFGRHIWDVPVSMNTDSSVQNYMVLSIFYGPTIFLAKLSLLLLYLETFRCLATIIGFAVLCVPTPGESWLMKSSTDACKVTANLFGVVTGVISVFSDVYVIGIPLPVIWQLNMTTRRKVGVSVIFVTGLFALVASIAALVYRIRQWKEQDNTWYAAYTYTLVVVEVNVSIMCSCMPSYAAWLRHHLPALRSLGSRIRSKFFSSYKQYSAEYQLNEFEKSSDDAGSDKVRLTLGSAVRDGKFLQTQQREWPLDTIQEPGKQMEEK